MTADSRAGSTAAMLAFLVWSFTFFALTGTTLLAWHPLARAIGVVLYAVPVIAWAILFRSRRVDRLDAAILVAVAAHLVVSFLSLDRGSSLEMSGVVLAYAATFWLGRAVAAHPAARRTVVMAAVMALVFWLIVLAITWVAEKIAAVEALGWPPLLEAYQPWVWGSINTAPVLVLLAAPFIAWLPSGAGRRILAFAWVAAALIVVPLSVGRAGWVAIVVAALSLEPLLGFPILRRIRGALGFRAASGLIAAGVIAVITGTAFALIRGGGIVVSALDSRLRLWDQAFALFTADPMTGAGPSTFGWARLVHVPDYVDRVAAKDAHSIPIQTLSDGGLLLAGALLVVVVAWVAQVVRHRGRLTFPARLSIAALIGYGAMGLLDDLSFLPAVTVLVILLAAWSIPPDEPASPDFKRSATLMVPLALLAAVIGVAPAVVSLTASRLHAATGSSAAVGGEWDAAAIAFRDAAELHPENAQLWMSLGLAESGRGNVDAAHIAYDRARAINPGDPRPWGALSALSEADADAIPLLDEAARRTNDARYAYRLGMLLHGAGRMVDAARSFALATTLEPDLFAVVPEELREAVAEALPDAVRAVGSVGGRDARGAIWNAGLALGELPDDAPAPWMAVAHATEGDLVTADVRLDQARRNDPNDLRTDQAASAVARFACDRDAWRAAEARVTARGATSFEGGHPVRLRPPGVYRLPELGNYQPATAASVPVPPAWPLGLVEVPDCGW